MIAKAITIVSLYVSVSRDTIRPEDILRHSLFDYNLYFGRIQLACLVGTDNS